VILLSILLAFFFKLVFKFLDNLSYQVLIKKSVSFNFQAVFHNNNLLHQDIKLGNACFGFVNNCAIHHKASEIQAIRPKLSSIAIHFALNAFMSCFTISS
jgi:hypothetical protein